MEVFLLGGSDSYAELGAAATQELGTTVFVSVDGDTVDPSTPGTYIVTYDARDESGNRALQVSRTVVVLPPILRVDTGVAVPGDGSSWTNAYRYLQDALTTVDAAGLDLKIWVAEGTYYPDEGAGQPVEHRASRSRRKPPHCQRHHRPRRLRTRQQLRLDGGELK